MRVLFITHRLPYAPNRGDRIRAFHMLRFLRRHATVEVVSMVHDADEAAHVHTVPADHVTTVATTPWRNRVRSALGLMGSTPLTHSLLDAPSLHEVVRARTRAFCPDVVIAFCSGVARLALLPELRDRPLVVDMVDVDSAKWQALAKTGRPPLSWIYKREARCLGQFERDIVLHARATLVVNERERQTLISAVPEANIRTIANGIDLDGFQRPAGSREAGPRIVFCGVMNYQPNEEAALRLIREIWPLVRTKRPDARLAIVGANPTETLRQLADDRCGIEVTGAVPDVRPYLWNAAVSAAPLVIARGVQNKVLEALAAQLPVVTTKAVADGLPAQALPGCVLAESHAEVAAAIVKLLDCSEAERREFARRADLSGLQWGEQLAPLLPILLDATAQQPGRRKAS